MEAVGKRDGFFHNQCYSPLEQSFFFDEVSYTWMELGIKPKQYFSWQYLWDFARKCIGTKKIIGGYFEHLIQIHFKHD